MELISVIVPIYNVEQYLEKCLNSIINQTYKALEIILIDDGSTDNSGKICDEFALRDDRIKVIHHENEGVASARNIGITNATGDFIMFVDSDDYIEPNTAEFLINQIHEFSADIATCGFKYADTNGNTWPQEDATIREGAVTRSEFWNYFYTDIRVFYVTLWAKLSRRSLWKDLYFPDGKLHEDEFITHSLVANSSKIAISKKPLYYYVQREGSIMHTQFRTQNLDAAEGMLTRCGFFIEKHEYDIAIKTLSMSMYSLTKGYKLLGNITAQDKKRINELRRKFRRLYRSLFFKKVDFRSKLKCGVFYVNMKLFMKMKKDKAV